MAESPQRAKQKAQRDELFDDKQAKFIELISEGKTWAQCAEAMKCAESTFTRWLARDDATQLRTQYALAREAQGDAYADRVIDVVENPLFDAAEKRVRMDAYKWAAGKRKPKVYGEKFAIGGADDLPPIRNEFDYAKLSEAQLVALAELYAVTSGDKSGD